MKFFLKDIKFKYSILVVICSFLIPPPLFADDDKKDKDEKTPLSINLNDHQLIDTLPINIQVSFTEPVKLSSFEAELNDIDISALFVLTPSGGTATLTIEDGLINLPEKNEPYAENELEIEIKTLSGEEQEVELKIFVDPNAKQSSIVTADIGPEGGELVLPGIAVILFPANTFLVTQTITAEVTNNPDTAALLILTGDLYNIGPQAPFEIRLDTGKTVPALPINVEFTVPDILNSSRPINYEFAVFAQVHQSNDDEVLDQFERILANFQAATNTVVAILPPAAFTDQRNSTITFEAIVALATAPQPPVSILTSTNTNNFQTLAITNALDPIIYQCAARADVRKVLAPPLDGKLKFGRSVNRKVIFPPTRPAGRFVHLGVDYRTRDWVKAPNGPGITGLLVRSIADGTVRKIHNTGNTRSWGQYIIIDHDDRSVALYAHLLAGQVKKIDGTPLAVGDRIVKDQVIGISGGASGGPGAGGSRAPHLHMELTMIRPVPGESSFPWKVDASPCVSRDLYAAIQWRGTQEKGVVEKIDLTSSTSHIDVNYTHSLLSSGGLASWNWQAGVFNRDIFTTGFDGLPDTIDYSFINASTRFGPTSSIESETNRQGVFTLDYLFNSPTRCDVEIKVWSHSGTFLGNVMEYPAKEYGCPEYFDVNDTHLFIGNIWFLDIFDIAGSSPVSVAEIDVRILTGENAATGYGDLAVSRDRAYAMIYTGSTATLYVFDLRTGGVTHTIPIPGPSNIWGIAVSEKRLYMGDIAGKKIRVYNRSVTRNAMGDITNDQYTFLGNYLIKAKPDRNSYPIQLDLE